MQLQRATPSRTVTSLNSPGLLLLAMRTMRSRGPSTAPRPRRAGQQIERFVQQANGAFCAGRHRVGPILSQCGPLTPRGRLHKLVDHRRVGSGLGFEHANVACLGFEQRRDEIIQRVLGIQVGDERRARLADAIDAVLGLSVVAWHPVEVVEEHVRRRGERDAGARGVDVADQHAH